MFYDINKVKIHEIKKAHENLKKNEFLRIFTTANVNVDLKYNEKFTITTNFLAVDKLRAFTESIVMFDVLELIE